jgi:hypothetical protein
MNRKYLLFIPIITILVNKYLKNYISEYTYLLFTIILIITLTELYKFSKNKINLKQLLNYIILLILFLIIYLIFINLE